MKLSRKDIRILVESVINEQEAEKKPENFDKVKKEIYQEFKKCKNEWDQYNDKTARDVFAALLRLISSEIPNIHKQHIVPMFSEKLSFLYGGSREQLWNDLEQIVIKLMLVVKKPRKFKKVMSNIITYVSPELAKVLSGRSKASGEAEEAAEKSKEE